MSKQDLVEVMKKAMPTGELAIWFDVPNLDLSGRTPREVFADRQYDRILEALWLRDMVGPVS
jgi:hypothetical protein